MNLRNLTPLDGKPIIGYVVDNSDPEKLGRVRVALAGLSDNIKKEHLPWYTLRRQADASSNHALSVPRLDSRVAVILTNDDPHTGEVVYALPSKPPEM